MQNHYRRRNSLRLAEFDYSMPNAYFVTMVCQNRIDLFGKIVDGQIVHNDTGQMVQQIWLDMLNRFQSILLDEFILMPNHFHGIIVLQDRPVEMKPVGASLVDARFEKIRVGTSPTPTIGDIIGAFKSITTMEYILGVENHGWPPFDRKIWQRGYYDRIIRNEKELDTFRKYISTNPLRWKEDSENR